MGVGLLLAASGIAAGQSPNGFEPASVLPDLSGLAFVGNGRFLAVHDAKNPDELSRPRVSLLQAPSDLAGILWKPLDINWNGMESSDLESVARIPGTNRYLLAESGDNGDQEFRRIFRGRLAGTQLHIERVVFWPVPVYNVEATAVARLHNAFYFIYAERADNAPSTDLKWAALDPIKMEFGSFQSVKLANPDPTNTVRAVVGLDVDRLGRLYTISSFDPETAGLPGDPDLGPFRSSVWRVGRIRRLQGQATIQLAPEPTQIAKIDGFKAESVAIAFQGHQQTIYVGFDDEDYGGTMRPMPPTN